MSKSGVPHRCEPCVEAGSYTGFLVFETMEFVPVCKVHGKAVTPIENPPSPPVWVWEPETEVA